MAIYLTDKDGSDQHFDTYAEFEQAMVLMSRIGGNKVPQDLLDEVSAKYVDKEAKPIKVEIDGSKVEEAIRKATEQLSEALDEATKNRTPISDECGVPEMEPKFEVGDKVKVVNNLSNGHPEGTVGVIGSVNYYSDEGRHSYGVVPKPGSTHESTLYHYDNEIESAKGSPTEFRSGDIVKVTETFEDSYGDALYVGDLHRIGKLSSGRVCISAVFVDGDNIDKLQLVCRKEDRKDVEL